MLKPRLCVFVATLLVCAAVARATPRVEQLAPNLYAYVSDNDHSANATFLVGQRGILVVDTGLNSEEGQKLLAEIRKISQVPVQFIVNTHYHPDHQGGNGVVGPDAIVISSPFTRERTLQLIAQPANGAAAAQQNAPKPAFRAAIETLTQKLTVYIDDTPVEITAPGPGHTMGDVYVFFPKQRTVSCGDLFMNNASPAMDQGSAENWVRTLDAIASLPADHFVPGHFEIADRPTFTHFRDYMADLTMQVATLVKSGATVEQVRARVDMSKYKDFRQFPQFRATFADNAEAIYREMTQSAH